MTGPLCLYVSYDGVLEPLGQSQILPYLRGLAASGIRFVLISFEKPADLACKDDVAALRRELGASGIRWVPLRYHKHPPLLATLWDVLRGAVTAVWLARRDGARLVHCRSYPASVIGLAVRRMTGAKFIFDMRGFWPEERLDGGLWTPSSPVFWLAKRVEGLLLRASDAIVVLTERARAVLSAAPYGSSLSPATPVAVIPCCVDVQRFTGRNASEEGTADGERILVYVGSVGTWYLLDEMLDFFATVARDEPELRFLILNRGEHELIRRRVRQKGLNGIVVLSATPLEVAAHLRRAWASMYFIKPVFSKIGASPTKLGEYLAAGLPVIVNKGVGDADELVTASRVGVVVERFAYGEYAAKWRALCTLVEADPGLRVRCRETARQALGLEHGITQYWHLYETMLARNCSCQISAGERR